MDRAAKLHSLICLYRVDRVALHSLVYLLENVYGVELGYRGCGWRLYATGPYCPMLEADLRRLMWEGLVVVGVDGELEARRCGNPGVRVDPGSPARLIREAYQHYVETRGRCRCPLEDPFI